MCSSRCCEKVANKSRTENDSLKVTLLLLRLLSTFHVTSRRQVIGTEHYSPTLTFWFLKILSNGLSSLIHSIYKCLFNSYHVLVLWRIQRRTQYYPCLQLAHNLSIILHTGYQILINMKLEKMLLTDTDLLIDVIGK